MIPAKFEYSRAASADEAIAQLTEYGDDAKLLAGGHSLLPLMKLRLATPGRLIDIGRVGELAYVRDAGDHLAIGALTRHRDPRDRPPRAHARAPCWRTSPVRSVTPRSAIGARSAAPSRTAMRPRTCLRSCSPSTAPSCVRGPGGEREIPASQFHRGFLETALRPDELLTEIRVPKASGTTFSFQKFNRRAQDWAIVGVVAVRNGSTSIGLVNMGSVPLRAAAVEAAIAEGASAADAAALAGDGTEPSSDLNASSEFRKHLARVLVRRALEEVGA